MALTFLKGIAVNKLKVILKTVLILFLLAGTSNFVLAQTNYLSQKISLNLSNVTLSEALTEIGKAGNMNFSYNAHVIEGDKEVSLYAESISISRVLEALLDENIRYKVAGQHIILLRKKADNPDKKELHYYSISGVVSNAETQQQLNNVSVYNLHDRSFAITDGHGSYSIKTLASQDNIAINFSKRGYHDTLVFIKPQSDLEIKLSLNPLIKKMDAIQSIDAQLAPSPILELELVNTFVPEEAIVNSENIRIYDSRPAQISFLPFIGSNAKVSGVLTNHISVNVLAGYSGAVDGCEIGSVLNITRRYVKGAQISGFGNITGDYVNGCQLAGFFNKTTGTVKGAQVAGFASIVLDTIKGVQVAGFSNISKGYINGLQLSGFNNYAADHVIGAQVTGFINVANKNVEAIQLAGFSNITNGTNTGVQVSGFLNTTRGTNKGLQVSGFLNIADTIKGMQIGIINISDTSNGVSIGVYNHVKKGCRSIELSANEVLPVNLSFRTGNSYFYNILTIGMNPSTNYPWGVGMGFGSNIGLSNKFSLSLELTASKINEEKFWEDRLNLLNRLSTTLSYSLSKNFTITAGPALNVHVLSLEDANTSGFSSDIAVSPFLETSSSDLEVQMWLGGSVGVSLRLP